MTTKNPDMSVTMAGVQFKSPIGVGPVGFPWGKDMPKHPELHAEVLLKHVKAGAGYIVLSGMFATEATLKKVLEKSRIEERHTMPEGGTKDRIMKANKATLAPYGLEGMFFLTSPFLITTDLARMMGESQKVLVDILMKNKPKDVKFIGNSPGLADIPDVSVDSAKEWEELGADMVELNFSCPLPTTVGGAVDSFFLKQWPPRFQGALIGGHTDIVAEITREVVKAVKIPVGVKISPEIGFPQVVGLAKAIRDAGAKYIQTFNSAVGIAPPDIYNGGKPLWPFSDGNSFCMSSGSYLRIPLYRNVAAIARFVPGLEIAAAGGLVEPQHIIEVMMLGATLAQPCTGVIEQGRGLIRRCNDFLKKFLAEQGYKSAQELIGLGQKYIKNSEDLNLQDGVIAQIDYAKCTKCGRCIDNLCTAIYSEKGKIKINVERCSGCGGCIVACESDAIKLVLKK